MPVKQKNESHNSCDCVCCSSLRKPVWCFIVLIVGILMLGQNLGWWSFWRVDAWTAVFIIVGLSLLLKHKR